MPKPTYSIVVPAYNEEEIIRLTHERLSRVLASLEPYEIVYVNDGSRDRTLSILREIALELSLIHI